jgi:hypothetical protein
MILALFRPRSMQSEPVFMHVRAPNKANAPDPIALDELRGGIEPLVPKSHSPSACPSPSQMRRATLTSTYLAQRGPCGLRGPGPLQGRG